MKHHLLEEWFDEPDPHRFLSRRDEYYLGEFYDKFWKMCHRTLPDSMMVSHLLVSFREFDLRKLIHRARDVRWIVETAQDTKFLGIIDARIDEWKQAVSAIPIPRNQSTIGSYTLNANEQELLARLLQKTQAAGYTMRPAPSIVLSYETPPIFLLYPELEHEGRESDGDSEWDREREKARSRERERRPSEADEPIPRDQNRHRPDTISIEELLGCYEFQAERIVIYERGIHYSSRHGYDAAWLRSVVLIHELAHWISHKLPTAGALAWPDDRYGPTSSEVHEGWAQLLTWWMAEEVQGPFKETFDQLNQHQSSNYHVYKQFTQYPVAKILHSLKKMRNLPDPAVLADWRKSI